MFTASAWLKTPAWATAVEEKKSSKKEKANKSKEAAPASNSGSPQLQPSSSCCIKDASCPDAGLDPPDSADPASHEIPCRQISFTVEEATLYSNTWILSLHSPVFRAMFSSQFSESSQPVVPLPGKQVAPMRAFLNCLHHLHARQPRLFLTRELIVPVLALIKEYQVLVLWEPCLHYLRSGLTKANIIIHFRDILEHSLDELEYVMLAELSLLFANCLRTLETQAAFQAMHVSVREKILSALCVYHRVAPANEVLGGSEWFGHDPNCAVCGRVKDVAVECASCLHENYLCSRCRQYGFFTCYACKEQSPLNMRRLRHHAGAGLPTEANESDEERRTERRTADGMGQ